MNVKTEHVVNVNKGCRGLMHCWHFVLASCSHKGNICAEVLYSQYKIKSECICPKKLDRRLLFSLPENHGGQFCIGEAELPERQEGKGG